jgi:hypothetical protein
MAALVIRDSQHYIKKVHIITHKFTYILPWSRVLGMLIEILSTFWNPRFISLLSQMNPFHAHAMS